LILFSMSFELFAHPAVAGNSSYQNRPCDVNNFFKVFSFLSESLQITRQDTHNSRLATQPALNLIFNFSRFSRALP